MNITTLLSQDTVLSQISCGSKKGVLEKISHIVADKLNVDSQQLFNDLIAREKIGSTGVGSGIAIPHVKISSELPATAVFIQCEQAVDYDAYDGNKVDLLFAIFVPEDRCQEYLSALSQISQKLLDKPFLRQLRNAQDDQTLWTLLQQ